MAAVDEELLDYEEEQDETNENRKDAINQQNDTAKKNVKVKKARKLKVNREYF